MGEAYTKEKKMYRGIKKLTVCYFVNSNDEEMLIESIKALKDSISRDKTYDININIYDDVNEGVGIDEDAIGEEVMGTSFNRNGFEMIKEMFSYFNTCDSDYVMLVKPNCVVNTFDYIEAITRRMSFKGTEDKLGQISSGGYGIYTNESCQILSKNAIIGINSLCSMMSAEVGEIMRKRMDLRGSNYFKIIDVLLEMSTAFRIRIEEIEGILGHIESHKVDFEQYENYVSVSFGSDIETMKRYVTYKTSKNHITPFEEFVKGKKVAVVGNADVDEDMSKEIDNHDIVIRINNFYNYYSGKVGTKVDALVMGGLTACVDKLDNGQSLGEDVVQKFKPRIFLITESSNQKINNIHKRYDGCRKDMLMNNPLDMKFTTGTMVLKILYDIDDVEVNLYAFDRGSKWKKYLNDYCSSHEYQCERNEEEELREKIFKKFIKI